LKVTVLGSGSSSGTPSVEAGWGACDPNEPKNRRLRPSVLVENSHKSLLIDTSPDLREQLLTTNIQHLDGVIYTHGHSDHLHGIDDLRGINRRMNAAIPVFGDTQTLSTISKRFPYVFEPVAEDASVYYKSTLHPQTAIHHGKCLDTCGFRVTPIDQDHGYLNTMGFRIDDFAYSTDLISMHDQGFEILNGIKVWMLGTFTDKPHPTHLHVDRALEWIERVKPERAYLTHLGFHLDYKTLQRKLPDNVFVAFDGLTFEV